ncbi:MAG: YicC family protein [Gammaproteobacteria bacterium]|nr:YicC family protein [Gammaproteobacteria bacterium]
MVKSMTAYASAEATCGQYQIHWELKSLNNRYLDISMRLPEALSAVEMAARELIQQTIGRGKLQATCRYLSLSEQAQQITLNSDRVSAVIASCQQIEAQMGVGKALNALDILSFPGVVAENTLDLSQSEAMVLKALSACLAQLQQSREAEGRRLQDMVQQRADKSSQLVAAVRDRRPAVVMALQNKLRQRLHDLLQNTDQERFEQELVSLAQKMDVDEELDRLDSHLLELKQVFQRDEVIGRRLDFLMQELNREANTLGSKSADVETTKAAVNLKVLIEQMREQVQNIE